MFFIYHIRESAAVNALEAGGNGASQAVKLCANIAANIIALMAFLEFLDAVLGWLGSLIYFNDLSFKVFKQIRFLSTHKSSLMINLFE